MSLTDRINRPDHRTEPATPVVELRGGTERRESPWMRRAREGALYGYDENGRPVAGKIMSAGAA